VHLERPIPSFLSFTGPLIKRAASCIYTTLTALIDDSKRLVSQSVIDACKKGSYSQDEQIRVAAKNKYDILKKWQQCPFPFAWEQPGEKAASTYALIVTLLTPLEAKQMEPLKKSNSSMSLNALAEHLINLGTTVPIPNHAPLLKSGASPMSLSQTVLLTSKLIPDSKVCLRIWVEGLEKLKIHFLPWHGNQPQSKVTTPDFWNIFKRPAPGSIPKELQGGAAQEIATEASNNDPSAPWTIPQDITEMKSFWKKDVLPSDWDLKHASLSSATETEKTRYVEEAYTWVKHNFNPKKTSHRLGIILAIMFSQLLPYPAYPSNPASIINPNLSSHNLTLKIRDLPWEKSKHKGTTQKEPFITMMSTMIISLLDSDSSLQEHLKENNNSFGEPWTDKHGELYKDLQTLRVILICYCRYKIYHTRKFGAHWNCQSSKPGCVDQAKIQEKLDN
jgi:hypothetical protein